MITRGEEGVTLFTDTNIQTIGTKARKVHDVSGAGDTAISTFVLADLSGASIEESAMISNYAAGRVCEEVGVVPISLEMIRILSWNILAPCWFDKFQKITYGLDFKTKRFNDLRMENIL